MIPEAAEKPPDGRTKTAKQEQSNDFFRYPIFEHKSLSSFSPPLSDEEKIIKLVFEAFHACKFEEAEALLGNLYETTDNRYIRIYALRCGCAIDIFLCNTRRFFEHYSILSAELQADIPHKKELEECIHELDATLGKNEYYNNEFKILPDYPYHESFLPHLTSLNAVSLAFGNRNFCLAEIRAHEINCIHLKKSDSLVDLQSMHIYLGCAYAFVNSFDEMTYHFKQALKIAEEHNLFYVPALQYYYMKKTFRTALLDFSDDFENKLEALSNDIHNRYAAFTDKAAINTVYRLLPRDDFLLLYFAVQGYSNKDVANTMHMSPGTVGRRYSEIYAPLGVKSKAEMIELYRRAENNPTP
ncbi:MAG TPA: hypothetical protein DDY98_02005 [Ruminococcaceae bacterium]|nr:hypothetical protein [Oscillospiraceae bacterium]